MVLDSISDILFLFSFLFVFRKTRKVRSNGLVVGDLEISETGSLAITVGSVSADFFTEGLEDVLEGSLEVGSKVPADLEEPTAF